MRRTCAVALALAASWPAVARAEVRESGGLHDARYCEVIEVKGVPPNAHAIVWNTIGLNRCPAARWNALDATELAKEHGDTLVLLNGPRHFLMDSASGETGGVRSFRGLRMRRLATIPLRTAADLVQTPYTDRTIRRANTWRWGRGRRVFELVAPGGDVYVMQSYSQIREPWLRLADLRSLGGQLTPPPGWRYRTRRLRDELLLAVKHRATIVQDELQNTYQLVTPAPDGERPRRAVEMTGRTHSVPPTTPGTVEDRGTVRGAPFGRGSIQLIGRFVDGRLEGTYRLTFPNGSIVGRVRAPFEIAGDRIRFEGRSRFLAGTGAYRGISSSALDVVDTNTLDGQNGRLSVTGFARYAESPGAG
ncbi:MAG TPA: hypothetical protein VJT75_06335 [Thermoleophilaceae bacterium]|nr:hypothetical protein [Thermoleophilaceae bacterium]